MDMGNPQNIREEIADLLKLDKGEREYLDSQSITQLVESLIHYTKSLENGYRIKEKYEISLSEFILRFKRAYINHLKECYTIPRFEIFMIEGKVIDRALTLFDEIAATKNSVTEKDLLIVLQAEKEKPLPTDILKRISS